MTNIRGQKANDYLRSLSNDLRTKEGKRKQTLLSKIFWHTWGWEWEDVVSGRQHWCTKDYCEKKNKAIKYLINTYKVYPKKDARGMYNSDDVASILGLENLHKNCGYEAYSLIEKLEAKKELEAKYNQTKEIGYKVVRVKNSKAFKPATELALQKIEYRIGKETTRFGNEKAFGGFAIFESLEKAVKWIEHYGEKILKVEYIKSNDTLWKKNPPSYCKGYNGYFAQSNGISYFEGNLPDGTVIADYVKPLELVL
jgi:hypothetical protein